MEQLHLAASMVQNSAFHLGFAHGRTATCATDNRNAEP
jgi:hypothetical protein